MIKICMDHLFYSFQHINSVFDKIFLWFNLKNGDYVEMDPKL
jgi:hypothetical protein